MRRRLDEKIRDLRHIRANIINVINGPRVHKEDSNPGKTEWGSPIAHRDGGKG